MEEQLYLLYGGNDLHAILLTEKQLSIIEKYYKTNHRKFHTNNKASDRNDK